MENKPVPRSGIIHPEQVRPGMVVAVLHMNYFETPAERKVRTRYGQLADKDSTWDIVELANELNYFTAQKDGPDPSKSQQQQQPSPSSPGDSQAASKNAVDMSGRVMPGEPLLVQVVYYPFMIGRRCLPRSDAMPVPQRVIVDLRRYTLMRIPHHVARRFACADPLAPRPGSY